MPTLFCQFQFHTFCIISSPCFASFRRPGLALLITYSHPPLFQPIKNDSPAAGSSVYVFLAYSLFFNSSRPSSSILYQRSCSSKPSTLELTSALMLHTHSSLPFILMLSPFPYFILPMSENRTCACSLNSRQLDLKHSDLGDSNGGLL